MTNDPLLSLFARWERRYQTRTLWAWLPFALIGGALLGWGVALIGAFFGATNTPLWAIVALVFALVACGVWAIVRLRRPLKHALHYFEAQWGLQERFSTAYEILEGRITSNGLTVYQLAQTREIAPKIAYQQLLPYTFGVQQWTLSAVVVVGLLIFVGVYPFARPSTLSPDVERAITEGMTALRDAQTVIAQDTTLTLEARDVLLSTLETRITALTAPNVTTESAFATLSDARRDLAQALASIQAQEGDEGTEGMSPSLEQALTQVQDTLAEQTQAIANAEAPQVADAQSDNESDTASQSEGTSPQEGQPEAASENAPSETAGESEGDPQEGQQGEQPSDIGEGDPQEGETGTNQGEQGQSPEGEGESGNEGEEGQGGAPETSPEGEGNPETGQSPDSGQASSSSGDGEQNEPSTQGASENTPPNEQDPDGEGEAVFEQIFSPSVFNSQANTDIVLETDDENAPIRPSTQDSTPQEGQFVPYNQVFEEYAQQANRALERGTVPLGLRDLIRSYFSGLQP